MKTQPRDYQRKALDAIISELRERVSTIVDMATGTGKTLLFAWLAMLLGGRVLILVHRDELKEQAIQKIHRVCPDLAVTVEQGASQGDRRRDRSLFDDQGSSIVVASKDTLCRPKRLSRFRPDDFDYVIIDEAHRAVLKNPSYAVILKHFCRGPIGKGTAKLVGVSASLDRLDGEAMAGLFQSVAYRYGLGEAINDGYLLQPKVKRVYLKGVRLLGLPVSRHPDGTRDVSRSELDRVMRSREYAYGVVRPLMELAGANKQGIIFCSGKASTVTHLDVANAESPRSAAMCLGEPFQSKEERRAAIERFRAKDVQFLVTCDVLEEGFDYDGVELVVLKPSKSRKRTAQMGGRGTRPLDGCVDPWPTAHLRKIAIANSPKPWCTLIDPCGASEEHSLVNVTDIYSGRYTKEKPASTEPPKPKPKPTNTDEQRAKRNAMEALEAERYLGLAVEVDFEMVDTDMMGDAKRKAGAVSRSLLSHPITPAQARWLEGRGHRIPVGMTKREAGDLIGSIRARLDASSASPAQKRLLRSLGLSDQVTRGEARTLLDRALKPQEGAADGTQAGQ